MIIDTQQKVFKTHLRRMITLLSFVIIVLAVILIGKLPYKVLGFNKYQWAIVISVIYILVLVLEGVFELNYFYFSDDKDTLTFRYFSLGYFNTRKSSIEIPKSEFLTYDIKEYLGGRKTKIILHRSVKSNDAKYSPVCLSILSEKELEQLKTILDRYKKK